MANAISVKQQNFIAVLCKRKKQNVPKGLEQWTGEAASSFIDGLMGKTSTQPTPLAESLPERSPVAEEKVEKFQTNGQREGLAFKVTYMKWFLGPTAVALTQNNKDNFLKDCRKTYGLMDDFHKELALLGPLPFPGKKDLEIRLPSKEQEAKAMRGFEE